MSKRKAEKRSIPKVKKIMPPPTRVPVPPVHAPAPVQVVVPKGHVPVVAHDPVEGVVVLTWREWFFGK